MSGIFSKISGAAKIALLKMVVVGKPILIGLAATSIVLGTTFEYCRNERGTSASYSLDPDNDNIVATDSSGVAHVVALSKNQAYIKAYYNYMSCNSYIKLVGDSKYSFKDTTQDFAGLQDYYKKESKYYLNSAFIKMADEMLNAGGDRKFYYPEQFIKSIDYQTDGSGNVKTVSLTDDRNALTAKSYKYIKEKDGSYKTQSTTDKISGMWDYGLGSVLQYFEKPFQKDQYIKCDYTTIDLKYYKLCTDEDGNTWWEYIGTIPANISGTNGAGAVQAMKATIASYTDATHMVEGPSESSLIKLVNRKDHIAMKLEGEDVAIGVRQFNDSKLKAFSNNTTLYPINIPLIKSAACFSGDMAFTYTQVDNSTDLSDGTSADDSDAVTTITIDGFSVHRTGDEITSVPTEEKCDKNPIGYKYLSSYVHNYNVYVPTSVMTDLNFKRRVEGDEDTENMLKRLGLLQPYTGGSGVSSGAVDGTSYTDDDVCLLAALIGREAGNTDDDRFMVGATFVNRIHSGYWGSTLKEVFEAPRQYSRVGHPEDITNIYKYAANLKSSGATIENNRYMYIADCCFSGKFTIPKNVIYQQSYTKDAGWNSTLNSQHLYLAEGNQIYCTHNNEEPETTDWADRTAPQASQVASLVASLAASAPTDMYNGNDHSSFSGDVDTSLVQKDPAAKIIAARRGETYYNNVKFDVARATSLQQKVATDESLLSGLKKIANAAVDRIHEFFQRVNNIFIDNTNVDCEKKIYGINTNKTLEKDLVYSAVTFSSDALYQTVATNLDSQDLSFLFVGDEPSFELGDNSDAIVPGVGTKIDGFISPTASYCAPVQSYNQTAGGVVLSAPSGTSILSIADGGVVKSADKTTDSGYVVTIEYKAHDKTYVATYKYLSNISVSAGQTVNKGTVIGISGNTSDGKEAFFFGFTIDNVNVDPMSYFYQASGDVQQYIDEIKKRYPNLAEDRWKVITSALTCVGKIPYFWAGGHEPTMNSTWNPEWAKVYKVVVGGKVDGQSYLYGLDCSGFIRYAFLCGTGKDCMYGTAGILTGYGSSKYSSPINASQLLPGDVACISPDADGKHIGIYLYTNDAGEKVYCDCSPRFHWTTGDVKNSSKNVRGNVGVAPYSSFIYYGRPNCYSH